MVASDLNRAVETARIAFDGSGIPVTLDWRLRECDYGSMNGMPRARLDTERRRRLDEPFPGGESWRQAVARVAGALDEIARRTVGPAGAADRPCRDPVGARHTLLGMPLETLVDAPFEWREGWEYTLPEA